jgi:hypothetical protein
MKKITTLFFSITASLLLINCKSEDKKDFTSLTKTILTTKTMDPLEQHKVVKINTTIAI